MRISTLAFAGTGLLFALATVASSCAKGSSETTFQSDGGTTPTGQGGQGGTAQTSETGGHSPATTSSSSSSSTGVGGSGGGTGGSGTGGAMDCQGTAMCSSAMSLDDIHGDDDNDSRIQHGHASAWFRLEVQEDSSSVISFPDLSYVVTLAEPPSSSYDLLVYEGDDSGVACTANPSVGTGNPKKVQHCWGDTPTVDDGRYILVEVRYLSGPCEDVDQWTLTIRGNPDDGDCP